MSDNGKEPIIGEQKEEPKEKVIFQAVLKPNNDVQVFLFSEFIPMVTYAQKLLDMIVTSKIVQQQMKSQARQPIITPKHGITDWLRRRR